MDSAWNDALRRAVDRQLDEMLYGSPAMATTARAPSAPTPPLTLAHFTATFHELTTDRRTLIVREIDPLRRAMALHNWEIVRAQGEPGYWLRRRTGPVWRIRVYRSEYVPADSVYVVDPDAPAAPRVVALGAVVTTVTALGLAGVDELVGR